MIWKSLLPVMAILCSATADLGLASEPGLMVYGETTRLDTFDPYTVHEGAGIRLSDLLFDALVDIGPGGDYKPSLAKSWKIEDGGTAVLFELRENIFWNPAQGEAPTSRPRPLCPEDIMVTIRLLKASQSEIPNRDRFSVVRSAERVDDTHVRVRLARAMVDPLRVLTFKILPAHVVGASPALKRDSDFAKFPVGTGPFQFVKANAQGEVLLQANPRYFAGKPKLDKIVMKAYADQTVMAQSLMFNSLDLITYVSPRDLGEILGDQRLSVVPYDALSFSFFAMNTDRGILKDKKVRQAIAFAINRQEMLEAFFQGKGRLISGPFPPTSWAYNLDVKPVPFDVGRAKALLSAAGLTDKDQDGILENSAGKPLQLSFAVPMAGESETIKRIVLAFQSYLESVGIGVDLKFMDWLVWKKKVLEEHDYDLTIASWSFDDASNISSLFHSSSTKAWGNNFVQYKNQEVDSLLTEADATSDYDKKRAIYNKLHAMIADETPYVFLWTLMHHAAHTNRLTGVRVEPFTFFKYITSWRMEPGRGAI